MAHSRSHRELLKNPNTDPGTILWLPATDPTLAVTPAGRLQHPVLVIFSKASSIVVCGITSFRSTPLIKKFPHEDQLSLRRGYLPITPAAPHPDTGEVLDTVITGTPNVPSSSKQSYVNFEDPFIVPSWVVQPLHGGMAKLTKQAMETILRKIKDSKEFNTNLSQSWEESKKAREKMRRDMEQFDAASVGIFEGASYNPDCDNSRAATCVRSVGGGEFAQGRNYNLDVNFDVDVASDSSMGGGEFAQGRNYNLDVNSDGDVALDSSVGAGEFAQGRNYNLDVNSDGDVASDSSVGGGEFAQGTNYNLDVNSDGDVASDSSVGGSEFAQGRNYNLDVNSDRDVALDSSVGGGEFAQGRNYNFDVYSGGDVASDSEWTVLVAITSVLAFVVGTYIS